MSLTPADFERLLTEPEGERLEFKSATKNYPFEKLVEYCAALANEGGGRIVLGATDARPRTVVGTAAFEEPGRTVSLLMERLRIRVYAEEIAHPNGRVLVFEVASRPVGMPVSADGKYFARSGDTLRAMTEQELKDIFDELAVDFSAQIEPHATIADLDPEAIERFRTAWRSRSQNAALDAQPVARLLEDAELMADGGVTRAALILMGTKKGLGKFLAQAEVIFEYRSSEASISHQHRIELRQGFLTCLDTLWNTINLRNEVMQYQDGLFRHDVPVMNEAVVREAVLNAVTHRDYRLSGSVFIKQFPRKLRIISPGGLPAGITVDNMLHKQSPRNRRVAESCARCGLVERSGQGIDRIFQELIREGKARPDFSGTDAFQVAITIPGEIQNPDFVRFLERVACEQQVAFSLDDLLALDAVSRGVKPGQFDGREQLPRLVEAGVVERIGRGSGVKYVLSRRFYGFLGKKGAYTRARGLDRETHKALLLKHITDSEDEGARLADLQQVLRELSRAQIQTLLREMQTEGKAHVVGYTKAGRWHPGPPPKTSSTR